MLTIPYPARAILSLYIIQKKNKQENSSLNCPFFPLFASCFTLLLELLALVSLGRQHDVVLEIQLGLVVALEGLKVNDEVVLDGEDGVGGQPGVVLGVELGGAALVLGVSDLIAVLASFYTDFFIFIYIQEMKLTMMWMWAGRIGCLSISDSSLYEGPSVGSEYAVGW